MLKKIPKLLLLIIISFFILIGVVITISSLFEAKSLSNPQKVRFVIPKGQAVTIIAQRLEAEKLIKSAWAFRLAIYKNHLTNKIQAGSFELSANMSTWEIAQALTVGTNDLWITLPEGWRREEIAESLAKQGLPFFSADEFLELSKGLEGQLFPDTYLVPREIDAEQLLSLLQNTFNNKVTHALSAVLAKNQLSLNEVLTLASLVQRESALDSEMPLVAQILLNRLAIQMPLQVDATLQYIKGFNQVSGTWWSTPLADDKKLDSLYNTYKYAGLPPGPICNPGLAAIQAVLNPTSTSALFYLHDQNGKIHTANNLQEHNNNVNKYLR
jgi:UPF0755 protein